ncbi:hypothetical protein FOA52_002486 [Chlamydomonas sp. UWO 241]|nr:hypothetical protein FOA52_002486 [Chlamydomonas sp. UWO 241]
MAAHVVELRELLTLCPLDEDQQRAAEVLVHQCSTAELSELGLGAPPKPLVPKGLEKLPMRARLAAVQRVMSSIEYNHRPGNFYNVSKDRPFCRIMDTARDMLREALPIKCIEAVFLGGLLTAGWDGLQRLPLGFKSKVNGETYRHIVLVVHYVPERKWGALGISRQQELMFKDLVFDSLAELVADYKAAYEKWWHKLHKARIGLPFEHDTHATSSVCWRHHTISPAKQPWRQCAATLDKFSDDYKMLWGKFRASEAGGTSPYAHAPPPRRERGNGSGSEKGEATAGTTSRGAAGSAAASPTKQRQAEAHASPSRQRPGGGSGAAALHERYASPMRSRQQPTGGAGQQRGTPPRPPAPAARAGGGAGAGARPSPAKSLALERDASTGREAPASSSAAGETAGEAAGEAVGEAAVRDEQPGVAGGEATAVRPPDPGAAPPAPAAPFDPVGDPGAKPDVPSDSDSDENSDYGDDGG